MEGHFRESWAHGSDIKGKGIRMSGDENKCFLKVFRLFHYKARSENHGSGIVEL